MKRLLLAFIALAFAGCSTVPPAGGDIPVPPSTNETIAAAFLESTTMVLVYEGVKNNPRYRADALALSAAIDAALSGSAVVNADTIAAFVARVAAERNMDPVEAAFFANIARTAYQVFSAKYGDTGILVTDPRAKMWIGAFNAGIKEGITALTQPTLRKFPARTTE